MFNPWGEAGGEHKGAEGCVYLEVPSRHGGKYRREEPSTAREKKLTVSGLFCPRFVHRSDLIINGCGS